MNKVLLNPTSKANADDVLRVADDAGLRDHTIFQTSGSTGAPKFVCLSQAALETSARAVNAFLYATSDDTWLLALPDFHVGGHSIRVRAKLSNSAVITLSGKWSVDQFMNVAKTATLVSLVPTQLFDLIEASKNSPPGLRAVIVGGGRLSPDLRERGNTLGWPVVETYGMTEAASQIACEGTILPIWKTRTDDSGRLSISGGALFSGYITGDDFLPSNEWFQTSDIVEIKDKHIRFIGRIDDTVKVLGELVSIPQLEADLPPNCAIVPRPNPRTEHELILVYENSVENPEAALTQFNNSHAGFERLTRVIRIANLPRSPLGKLQRTELQKRVFLLLG